MNMFGLEGSGFIISLGVTLLMAGIIVYYVNSRFTNLEKSIIKQNQILGEFIGSFRNNPKILTGGQQHLPPKQTVSNTLMQPPSNENIDNSQNIDQEDTLISSYSNTNPINKIVVSDNEHESNDESSDSDSESDSDYDTESVSTVGNNDTMFVDEDNHTEPSKIAILDKSAQENDNNEITALLSEMADIEIHHIENNDLTNVTEPEKPTVNVLELIKNHNEEENKIKTINLADIGSVHELDNATAENANSVSSSSLSSNDTNASEDSNNNKNEEVPDSEDKVTYKKMKVKDLRELVVNKNLYTKNEAKSVKKKVLVEALENAQ